MVLQDINNLKKDLMKIYCENFKNEILQYKKQIKNIKEKKKLLK